MRMNHIFRRLTSVSFVHGLLFMLFMGVCPASVQAQVTGKNLLRNASFEVPGDNFWGFGGSKLSEENFSSDAAQGTRSLRWPYVHPMLDWPYRNPYTGQNFASLSYQAIQAQAGAQYTLSAYAKYDPASQFRGWMIFRISLARPTRGSEQIPPLVSPRFDLTTNWQRYSWAVSLPEADRGQYVLSIEFSGDPPWQDPYPNSPRIFGLIDGVQFERGELSAYEPAETLSVGLYPIADANAFLWGADVLVELYAANTGASALTPDLMLSVEDYWGNEVLTRPLTLSLAARQRSKQTLSLGASLRGHFRILVKQGSTVLSEKIFSVIPPARVILPEESIFGADVNLSNFMLTLARKLGILRVRPHADLGWEFIEPSQNNFTFPDYRMQLVRDKGMLAYGFLYRIPPWARRPETPNYHMPATMSDWDDYVYRVVDHYKGDIKYWEIMNEPCHEITGVEYLALIETAYNAAKRADPQAKLGGWSTAIGNGASRYCYDEVSAQMLSKFEFLTGHYYPGFGTLSGTALYDSLKWHAQVVSGSSLPVWNTEGGASGGSTFYRTKTDYDPLDERSFHARMTAKSWVHHKAANTPMFYYWLNFPSVGDHSPGYTYSWTFNEYDSSLKASAVATAFAAYLLDGHSVQFKDFLYRGTLEDQYLTMLHFTTSAGGNVLGAWSDIVDRSVELRSNALPAAIVVYDMLGREVQRAAAGQAFSIKVAEDPIYLVVDAYEPALITKDFLRLGVAAPKRSILIGEVIEAPASPALVEIFGSSTSQPGDDELLYKGSLASGAELKFAWDAPVLRSEPTQVLLFHMDQQVSFAESATRVKDFSPQGNHGTLVSVSGSSLEFNDTFGKFAGAFRGRGGQFAKSIKVSNSVALNQLSQFSVSFWVNRSVDNGANRLFCKGDANSYEPGLVPYCARIRETGGELIFRVSDGSITRDRWGSKPLLADGLWHHVAFVFDGTPGAPELRRMDIYVDGVLSNGLLSGAIDGKCAIPQASSSPTCPIPSATLNSAEDFFILGHNSSGPSALLDGAVDEFAMYSRALSSVEVAAQAGLRNGTYYWYVRTTSNGSSSQSSVRSGVIGTSGGILPQGPSRLRVVN
jgi:hypothetical protein